jgi:hypothetical protein
LNSQPQEKSILAVKSLFTTMESRTNLSWNQPKLLVYELLIA